VTRSTSSSGGRWSTSTPGRSRTRQWQSNVLGADIADLLDEDIVAALGEVDSRRLSLCPDDRDVVDLVEMGGVDSVVKKVIDLGVDPAEAVQNVDVVTD
jgi:hypothetical protein